MNPHGGDNVQRYAAVNDIILKTYGQKCLDTSYDSQIKQMRQVSWNASAAVGGRQVFTTWNPFVSRLWTLASHFCIQIVDLSNMRGIRILSDHWLRWPTVRPNHTRRLFHQTMQRYLRWPVWPGIAQRLGLQHQPQLRRIQLWRLPSGLCQRWNRPMVSSAELGLFKSWFQ